VSVFNAIAVNPKSPALEIILRKLGIVTCGCSFFLMLFAVSCGRIRPRAISTSALYESPFDMFDVLPFSLSKYAGASPRFVWACTSRFDHIKLHKMPAPVVVILCSFMIIVFDNRFWIVDCNEVN
jgi:hypothetical protein